MYLRTAVLAPFTLFLLTAAPAMRGGPVLYGVTFDDKLITINTATGAGAMVGNLSSAMSAFGIGTRFGKLYAFDSEADRVRELSPVTAATIDTIDVGIVTGGEGALAFRSDGTGFLSKSRGDEGTLWKFDIGVPNSMMITAVNGLVPSLDGLDFSPNGSLYGISQDSAKLYTINPNNGATTLVGQTNVTASAVAGLAFHPDGTLYYATRNRLYTIDPTNAQATLVGAIGFDQVCGLTFR